MLQTKPKPCKYCGNTSHVSFQCGLRQKPLKTYTQLKTTKPINKRGKQAKAWIATKDKWLEQNKAPYYWCHYCGKQMTRSQLTLDHMEARSRRPDLRHKLSNLVPCCWNCNTLKGSLSHAEYVHQCH